MDIWEATEAGNAERVAFLIKQRIQVDTRNKYGVSPLHVASKADHPAIVELLIDHGAMIDAQDKYGNTPLQQAVRSKSENCIEKLLLRGSNADIENKDTYGPLHWASRNGDTKIVHMLLSYRANPEKRTKEGETPLHLSAAGGHVDTINVLIDAGANPDTQDNSGKTALHHCSLASQVASAKLLLSRGANWEIPDNDGKTARGIAKGELLRIFDELSGNKMVGAMPQQVQADRRGGVPPNSQRPRNIEQMPPPQPQQQMPPQQSKQAPSESDILAMLQAEQMKSMNRTALPEMAPQRSMGNLNSDHITQLEDALQQKTVRLHRMHEEIQELVEIQNGLEATVQYLRQENDHLRLQLASSKQSMDASQGHAPPADVAFYQMSLEKKDQEIRLVKLQLEELQMNSQPQCVVPPELQGRLEEQQAIIARLQQQLELERRDFLREKEEYKAREISSSYRKEGSDIEEMKRKFDEVMIQREAEARVLRDIRVEFEEMRMKREIAESQAAEARGRLSKVDEERKQEVTIYRSNMQQFQEKMNVLTLALEQEASKRKDCETRLSIYQKTAGDLHVQSWLAALKLERYAPDFHEHEIDMDTLPLLTDQDMIDIGVKAIGPRRKIMAQIATRRTSTLTASGVSNGYGFGSSALSPTQPNPRLSFSYSTELNEIN